MSIRFSIRGTRTAEFMALFRAIESGRPSTSRLFADPLAKIFLSWPLRLVAFLARFPGTRSLVVAVIDRRWPGPRSSAVVRTRLIDDAVGASLTRGCRQLVFLGSGFDSRPYRLAGIDAAEVFEVDRAVSQQVKQAALERRLGELPANVSFVAVDFEADDLAAELTSAGFRPEQPTVVVWEGVTNYLSSEAVDRTFRTLREIAAPDSQVVFTYVHRGALDGTVEFDDAPRWISAVRRAGEPFTFGFVPDDLRAYLIDRGFTLDRDVSTAQAADELLRPLRRGERGSELYHVAIATASGRADQNAKSPHARVREG